VPAVLPIDVAEAYTAFANLGEKVEPRPILRVEDPDGSVVWEIETERERVLDPEVAYIMVDMLKTVVNAGSGRAIRDSWRGNVPDTLAVGGKTGTTNDATDVWFAGFTPDLLAVVWLGLDMPQPILPSAAGGTYAAPVWADFVRPIYFGGENAVDPETGDTLSGGSPRRPVPADWLRPADLVTAVIDAESGKLFSADFCPGENMLQEVYIEGTQPTELCDLHAPGLFGAPVRGLPQVLPEPVDSLAPDSMGADTSGGGAPGG
jgi:penicillin-binding protein 1A